MLLATAGVEEGTQGTLPAPARGLQGAGPLGTEEPGSAPQQDELDPAGKDTGSSSQRELDPHCAHGSRVLVHEARGQRKAVYRCECWDGWRTAGITDTLDWIEGSCNQFQCESDKHCQDALGIEGAHCPVVGWNCYCGWGYAMMDKGKGWDPRKDGTQLDGECMGVMYTFSLDATSSLKDFLEWAWMPFVTIAVLLLPFGRKRAVCDHHKPSLWNGIRRCFCCTIQCTGGCVMSTVYDLDVFKDDLAWTIWALDVMVWVYLFTLVLLVTLAWICSLVVWAVILVALMVAMIAGVCMVCFAGADGGGGGGEGCDCFKVCEGGGADAAGGDCCAGMCGGGAAEGAAFYEPFYWGGPMPMHAHNGCFWSPYYGGGGYDYGYHGHGGQECNCCDRQSRCCNFLCKPVALLLYVYPTLPENMWGGLLGYFVMGTHHMTPERRAYQGGNWIVDWMMGQRPADLHGDTGWRRQVHDFLAREEEYDNPVYVQPGGPLTPGQEPLYHEAPGDNDDPNIVRIPGSRHCRAFRIHPKHFEMEEHRLWESSYDDYKKNVCWICQSSNDNWDMWMSCRHMFCESCSTQMLKRRMPCPLCRVSSNTVLRGPKYPFSAGASSTEPYGNRQQMQQGCNHSPEGGIQLQPLRGPGTPPATQEQRPPLYGQRSTLEQRPQQHQQRLYGQRSMLVDGRATAPAADGQRNSRDHGPL